jgi:outer membrane protein OmpA-like peptidoglycan-associated protein
MKPVRVSVLVPIVVVLGILLTGLSGCRVMLASHHPVLHRLLLPAARTSVLIIITSPDSLLAMRATGVLAARSARPGERLLILNAQDGAIMASSQAPPPPSLQIVAPPAPLPSHATGFQRARHAQAVRHYQSMLLGSLAFLQELQHQALAAWAESVVAKAYALRLPQTMRNVSISADLEAAASDLFSLRQAGLGFEAGTVIAIMGVDGTAARFAPTLPPGLQDCSVVVDNYLGSTDEQAAWQSSLMQGGAARVVLTTSATEDQLVLIVWQGLDGAVTDTLTSVLFAPGQYRIQAAALPQMRHLLDLLVVKYPRSIVTINGYTDNLPVSGGNLRLSQLRAQAVELWLIAHNIPAGRMQAFGYGDSDPVAPNTSDGQPLNRRVVIVIDPATPAGADLLGPAPL